MGSWLKVIFAQEDKEACLKKAQEVAEKMRNTKLKPAANTLTSGIEESLTYLILGGVLIYLYRTEGLGLIVLLAQLDSSYSECPYSGIVLNSCAYSMRNTFDSWADHIFAGVLANDGQVFLYSQTSHLYISGQSFALRKR